mmetsp:Transcript_35489/g.86026  ORF Transcript_35489/g.86026 Transcript_35489/m.86026 type:complete len:80 (+) Transcript_35489:692-931(+)
MIRGSGGLFLKRDGDKWVPADDEVSILKVSAAFRTLRGKRGNLIHNKFEYSTQPGQQTGGLATRIGEKCKRAGYGPVDQ